MAGEQRLALRFGQIRAHGGFEGRRLYQSGDMFIVEPVGADIGAPWNKTSLEDKPFVSGTLAAPELGPRKINFTLGSRRRPGR